MLLSVGLAYAGSLLYAWRRVGDGHRSGRPAIRRSLHLKLTGAMIAVMVLDGGGYLLAVSSVPSGDPALVSLLQDVFVAVAILTVTVGLVLPGMISHTAEQVSDAAARLAEGTLADLTRAMRALSTGDLGAAKARVDVVEVEVRSRDELGAMAASFNAMQHEVGRAAEALDDALEGLAATEAKLERNLVQQTAVAGLGRRALEGEDLQSLVDEAVVICRAVLGLQAAVTIAASADGRDLHAGPQGGLAAGVAIGPDEAPLGTLRIDRSDGRRPAPHERAFLQAIGNVLADAIERRRAEEAMRHRALHDPLTELPNRTLFIDRLALAVQQSVRRGSFVAALFLDLDHFKLINDSRGHRAGDELLCGLSSRLTQAMRPGDTVARFGGDEFCIICDDLHDPGEITGIAQRLLDELARPFNLTSGEHFVSASLGIAVSTGLRHTAEDLVREADAAMYRAKGAGRGRYELFDELMRDDATERLSLENDLRRALAAEDELVVHYQPIVALADGAVSGVEALVRWDHPERGMVSPGQFIPIAEDSGAILAVGELVLRVSCRQAAAWNAARPDQPLVLSVNLSPRQAAQPGLAAHVATVLLETGLDASRLHLEITESALMEDSEVTARNLRELHALGVWLVLDDFGTGYSSLAYLRRFPIDRIKIDRRFVDGLRVSRDDTTIVEAIVRMAAGLRLDVVAEGVETVEQAHILEDLGCPHGQGYLWSGAVPADEMTERLSGAAAVRAGS